MPRAVFTKASKAFLAISGSIAAATLLSAPARTAAAADAGADIFVSPSGNDDWSGRLASPNASGSDGPVRTIGKAQALIRAVKASQRRSGAPYRVLLRGGVYRLEQPLLFGQQDSGLPGAPMVYAAYPGETVVLSGGSDIGRWKPSGNGLWQAPLPGDLPDDIGQAFVNDRRANRPRIPGAALFSVPAAGGADTNDRYVPFEAGSPLLRTPLGPSAEFVGFFKWSSMRVPIDRVSPQDQRIYLKSLIPLRGGKTDITRGTTYYIDNAGPAYLAAGQWSLSRDGGTILYRPQAGEQMKSSVMHIPRLPTLIRLDGGNGGMLSDFQLKGIQLRYAGSTQPYARAGVQAETGTSAALEIRNAERVAITDVGLTHIGGAGIRTATNARNIDIGGCRIEDAGGGGIYIGENWTANQGGPAPTRKATVSDISVSHCRIAFVGRYHHGAVGIWAGQAQHVQLVGNVVHDLYYTGISMGWTWGYRAAEAYRNLIRDNIVYNVGGQLSDLAGIYTLGPLNGTEISDNLIFNISRREYGGWGIYADEGSTGLSIHDNVVALTQDASFFQHYGADNVVRNNLFIRGGNAIECGVLDKPSSITVTDNIVIGGGVSGFISCGGRTKITQSNNRKSPTPLEKAIGKTVIPDTARIDQLRILARSAGVGANAR